MLYANVINSPSSNVMPDDIELYNRCQEGNATRGGEWVSMHRYHGTDRSDEQGMVSVNGTSELPMRNQFRAWRDYMQAGPVTLASAEKGKAHAARPDFDVATDNLKPADVPAEAYHRIAQFLYREARLLDEHAAADWHALWTEDGMYWMPRVPGQKSPYDHVSLFWEDRMLRDVRIRWSIHANCRNSRRRSARLVGGCRSRAWTRAATWGAFGLPDDRVAQAPAAPAGRTLHSTSWPPTATAGASA